MVIRWGFFQTFVVAFYRIIEWLEDKNGGGWFRWFWLKKVAWCLAFPYIVLQKTFFWKMVAERCSFTFFHFNLLPLHFAGGTPSRAPKKPHPQMKLLTGDSARSNEIGIKLYIALKLVVLLWCWPQMSPYHGEVSGGFSWVFWLVVWNIFYFHPYLGKCQFD